MRFHAARGSMSVGESAGGLPPDSVVEDEDAILADTDRLIRRYHDDTVGSMLRIVVAPCSPFSVSRDLMRESAELARSHGVHLHTHLAENVNDIDYCREKCARTPVEYADELGWTGDDVWHAHCVHLDRAGIEPYNGIQGESLLDVVAGNGGGHDSIVIEDDQQRTYMGFEKPPRARTLITDRWRLSIYQDLNWGELYDLSEDPHEMENLWDDPERAAIRGELFETLARRQMELVDRSPLPTATA